MRVQLDGRGVVRPLGPTIELDITILQPRSAMRLVAA
jgi:hypothetical protein